MSLFTPSGAFGKDTWRPGLVNQLERTPGLFYNMLDVAEPERIQGRNAYFKLDISDLLSVATIGEGGDFPTPIDPEYEQGKYETSRLAGSTGLTFDEWEFLNSDAAAAVPVVQEKLKKALEKVVRELARQSHMDGEGKLARCASSSTTTTINLQSTATSQIDRDRWNWLVPKRTIIDIVDATTGAAVATDRLVTARSKSGNTITISGANISTTTSHVIVWKDAVDPFSSGTYTSGEFDGLGAVMKTSRTYLGINSATAGNDYWDPRKTFGSSPGTPEAFTLHRLQELFVEMADYNEDGTQPTPEQGYALFSNLGAMHSAINNLQGDVRYVNPQPGDTASFGFTRLEGLGLPWYGDIHYAHNVIDCLRISGFKKVKVANPMQDILDFVTTGSGDMWHLANASSGQGHATKVYAYLTGRFGICTLNPNQHGRMDDVTELGGSN